MKNIFFALKNLPFCPRMSADQIYLQIFLLNASLYNLRCPDWALVQEFRQWVFLFTTERDKINSMSNLTNAHGGFNPPLL